ncbi:MAG: HEAT repeat domain-containing protein [Candidatus Poribacteria bacterium]
MLNSRINSFYPKKIVKYPVDSDIVICKKMLFADINNDKKNEIIVIRNKTSANDEITEIAMYDQELNFLSNEIRSDNTPNIITNCIDTEKMTIHDQKPNFINEIQWRTFRHSWIWDIQIADIDSDGDEEIITFGGTSMTGRDQEDANIIGEIIIRDGKTLELKDIMLWQTNPGDDTRPTCGLVIKDKIIIATSKLSKTQKTKELELMLLDYKHKPKAIGDQLKFIKACNDKDSETLSGFALPENDVFSAIALEAFALCGDDRSLETMGDLLGTDNRLLFLRNIQLLRRFGTRSVPQFRKAGFSIQNDWIVVSPFDNSDNIGFDTVYPPEIEIDFDKFYAGKGRIVKWGKFGEDLWDDRRFDTYADLAYTYFDSFERTGIEYGWNNINLKCISYLLTYVNCPKDIDVQFRLGSTNGVKVWVNNKLVFGTDIIRECLPDLDIFPVSLSKGKNTVLLKLVSKSRNPYGFYFRITDINGKQIKGLEYEQPEVSYIHNQMIPHSQLIQLLESSDDRLKYLAGVEVADSGDKRGNAVLVKLLKSKDLSVQANSALALTSLGDKRGVETLVKVAPSQDHLFQISAGNALNKIGDVRSEQFSPFNLKDEQNNPIISERVLDTQRGFRFSLMYKGEETSHVDIKTNLSFLLGDLIAVKCASIASFGIREPEYRAMGLGAIALKKACNQIFEMGHSCTIVSTGKKLVAHRLYCQTGFYDRRLQTRFEKHLNSSDADYYVIGISSRIYKDSDKKEVLKLRDQYYLTNVGPLELTPQEQFDERTQVIEQDGRLIGYANVKIEPYDPTAEIEFFHIDNDLQDKKMPSKALFAGIHKYALSKGKTRVMFYHSAPYLRDILYSMGYDLDASMRRHEWVGMFRIASLPVFLREISELLTLRMRRSRQIGWEGSFAINGDRLKATVIFDKDGVVNVEDDAHKKADLIFSADDNIITALVSSDGNIWEWYRQNLIATKPRFNERIRDILESLFPTMPCMLGPWW